MTASLALRIALEQAVQLACAGRITVGEIVPTAEGLLSFLEAHGVGDAVGDGQ